jgi:hypothetical protein
MNVAMQRLFEGDGSFNLLSLLLAAMSCWHSALRWGIPRNLIQGNNLTAHIVADYVAQR